MAEVIQCISHLNKKVKKLEKRRYATHKKYKGKDKRIKRKGKKKKKSNEAHSLNKQFQGQVFFFFFFFSGVKFKIQPLDFLS